MIPSGLLTGRILRPARIFPSFQKPVFSLKMREGGGTRGERTDNDKYPSLPSPLPLYLTKLNYQFEIIERYTLFLSVRTGEGNVTKLTYAKRHRIYRRSQLPFAIGPNPYRFPSTPPANSPNLETRPRRGNVFASRNGSRGGIAREGETQVRGACNCRNPTRVRSLAHATNARVIWALGARQRRGMRGEVTEFGRVEKKRRRRRSRTNGRASRGGGQRYRLDDINVAPAISILCLLVSP